MAYYMIFDGSFMKQRYWIGVASKDHVCKGVEGSFSQVCHGKDKPLKRMKKNDWIVYYSNVEKLGGNAKVQAFTAIGKVLDDNVYQFEMAPGFVPYRRDVKFVENAEQVSIKPLINKLDFIEDKQRWGYKFKYGHFEISKKDFFLIANEMKILRRKMKSKKVMEQYLNDFNSGKSKELFNYYSEEGVLVDFKHQEHVGIDAVKAFYEAPMPPAVVEIESWEEVTEKACAVNITLKSKVMGEIKLLEKLLVNDEGKILKFEMIGR